MVLYHLHSVSQKCKYGASDSFAFYIRWQKCERERNRKN